MTTLLEQAKQNLDKELDIAQAKMLARWQAHVSARLLVEKEVTDTTAMICWTVPIELAEKIVSQYVWPEGSEPTKPEELHVTIKYLGEIDDVIADMVAHYLQDLSRQAYPFDILLTGVDVFTGVEDGTKDAVYISIESPVLLGVKERVERDIGNIRPDDYLEYTPHITLAYVPTGSKWVADFVEGSVLADNLTFARGGEFVQFPLIGVLKGGKGSGNYGHKGRPGKVGGSSPVRNPQSGALIGSIEPDIILYHGTAERFVDSIRQEGLKANISRASASTTSRNRQEAVFFSADKQEVLDYIYTRHGTQGDYAIVAFSIPPGNSTIYQDTRDLLQLGHAKSYYINRDIPAAWLRGVEFIRYDKVAGTTDDDSRFDWIVTDSVQLKETIYYIAFIPFGAFMTALPPVTLPTFGSNDVEVKP